jgi:hypothetical protein
VAEVLAVFAIDDCLALDVGIEVNDGDRVAAGLSRGFVGTDGSFLLPPCGASDSSERHESRRTASDACALRVQDIAP